MSLPNPYVVGVDTASNRWHAVAASIGQADNWHIGECGPVKGTADERRIVLYHTARKFFEGLPPRSHIFCEEPLALGNGKTTRLLGLAAGAIWAAHMGLDLFWYWVDVGAWKADVCGRITASKDEVEARVRAQGRVYDVEDLFDADAIRMYGAKQIAGIVI